MKRFAFAVTTLALVGASILPARAVVFRGPVWRATYIAAYSPTFGPARIPYAGVLKLSFNHGIVKGTYVSESVRPDPLYGRTIPVGGGIQHGEVLLNLSAFGGFTINGTMHDDGSISGNATIRGNLYNFRAKVKPTP